MTFRANESRGVNTEQAVRYLTPKGATQAQKQQVAEMINMLTGKLGAVVDGYPVWHPLMAGYSTDMMIPVQPLPDEQHRFPGLDHTVWFTGGFITFPYRGADILIEVVNKRRGTDSAAVTEAFTLTDFCKQQCEYSPEKIPVLYSQDVMPVVVRCDWLAEPDESGFIPEKIAVPLMLEYLLCLPDEHRQAESWNDIKGDMLGYPHGAKSSLFVTQETGQALKNIWGVLSKTAMFD
ncbi:TPA: hypothetical protein I7721_02820 [Vibrio vulnificus]|nr:hypothetical protein [Vibrio vulnificus]